MKKKFYLLLPIYFCFFIGLVTYEVIHPPFSSDSVNIGDNEIQIETTPPVPEIGKDTIIHFRVFDKNGDPVDMFRMALQIYYNNDLIRSFPPSNHVSGSWDLDYVFEESGNHVIRIDFYDLKAGGITSHAFNVSVLNFYNNIFYYLIISGIGGAGSIILILYIIQRRGKPKRRFSGRGP